VALAPAADAGKAASAAILLGSDPKHQIVEEKDSKIWGENEFFCLK